MTTLATGGRAAAPSRVTHFSTPVRVAAEAAVFSAGIHLWVAPAHLREWWLYGVFFLAVFAAQAGLAWLLLHRASVLVLLAGIWGNIALIGVYVASRTVGLPLTPPHAAHQAFHHLPIAGGIGNGIAIFPEPKASNVEAVGTLDLFALGAELVLIVVLVGMLPDRLRRVTTNLMLAGGIVVWALRATLALA